MENSSLSLKFQILKPDTTLVAEGEMISVKVDANGKPISITDDEHAKLLAK